MSASRDIQREINNGRLVLRPGEYQRKARLFGTERVVPKDRTPAHRLAHAVEVAKGTTTVVRGPASETIQVGEAPEGFGKTVQWHEEDAALALVVFLNASDPLGVAIQGVTAGDTIDLVSADGQASFAEDIENEGVSSLIGIVGAGASATAAALGQAELIPAIAAAQKFAQDKFKERQVETLIRNAYGLGKSGPDDWARQEGGVLVCRPEAHGIYYSGEDERLWIKPPGTRIDSHRPDHMGHNAHFIRRGMGRVMSRQAGDLYLVAWDFDFPDNTGFYELHVIMRRGDLPPVLPGSVE